MKRIEVSLTTATEPLWLIPMLVLLNNPVVYVETV